jgi:type IV secretion system protein TrbI
MAWRWRSRSQPTEPLPTSEPAVGQVQDHRPRPSGVLPAHVQTWAMLGLGLLITVIVLYTQSPAPMSPGARNDALARVTNSQVAAEFRKRIEEQERLLAEARRKLAEQQAALEPPAADDRSKSTEGRGGADPQAAIRQDRLRREYESLYADQVAFSSKAQAAAGSGSPAGADPAWLASLALAAQTHGASAALATPTSSGSTTPTSAGRSPEASQDEAARTLATSPLRADGPWHRLLEGTVLEGVLTTRLDGDFNGPVQAMLTTPVYSHDSRYLLIPAGTRLLGSTRTVTSSDQRRLAVTLHRLVFPDGRTMPLERAPGLNQLGETGLEDQVNRHYLSVFGSAVAIAAISGLANTNFGMGHDNDVVIVRGTGVDQAGRQMFEQFLNRRPTITIREGHRLRVLLTADIELPVYRSGVQPQRPPTRAPSRDF